MIDLMLRSCRAARMGLVAGLSVSASLLAVPVWPQHHPGDTPSRGQGEITTGGGISRYKALYGPPEFRSLDSEFTDPWPVRQAIRTIGRVLPIPGRGRQGSGAPAPGLFALQYDNQNARYQLCGEQVCVAVTPVREAQEAFEWLATGSQGEALEVVGAVDGVSTEAQASGNGGLVFSVWEASEALKATTHREAIPGSTLEPLVRYPKSAEGRVVTVSGTFRGANLFEDLPPDSRRGRDSWVLRDGPFSIWITGKDPKGQGFSLDVHSKADCRIRLEVQGEIVTENDYIYLRARKIQLLGRAPSE
jgi:hypothetical protein